jgi:quinolinate synthase
MKKYAPEKTYIEAPPDSSCACNECPYMKKNTLEKLYLCLRDGRPQITLDEDLRKRALVPIQRMLDLS